MVILGPVPLIEPRASREVEEFLQWADEARTLRTQADADAGSPRGP
jgi:hypothetical protein